MLHEPATPASKDPAGAYKMRLGIWMFILYTLFYAGFVAINLIIPNAMAIIVFRRIKPGNGLRVCLDYCGIT